MVVNRTLDDMPPDKRAATTTTSQVIDQRLRSEAAKAATKHKPAGRETQSKERWVTKTTSNEFGASLGKADFQRVTGTYTPGHGSPAWDPAFDTGAPFHRSTPSGELEDEIVELPREDEGLLEAAHKVTRRGDRMDNPFSTTAASGETCGTGVTLSSREELQRPLGAVPKVTCGTDAGVARVITVTATRAGLAVTTVVSSRIGAPSTTGVIGSLLGNPATTSNPFGEPGLGSMARHLLGTTLERGAISPIPSVASVEAEAQRTATAFSNTSGRQDERSELSPVAAAVAKGQHLVGVVNDEFGSLDVDTCTADLLRELCLEANSHKRSLTRVEEKLLGVPSVQRHRTAFAEARSDLFAFIRAAQRRIHECQRSQEASWRAAPAPQAAQITEPPAGAAQPTAPQPRLSSLSAQLKRDRVIGQEHRIIEEMSAIVAESQALQKAGPTGDTQIQLALEKGRDLKDRGADLAREALSLYNDAVDVNLGAPAKAIYDCM